MKHYLVFALAALGLFLAAPSAFATRVVFDPPSSSDFPAADPNCSHNDPCNITQLDHSYQVEFIPCDTPGVGATTFNWCLWLNNVTGHAVSTFTFTFAVPAGVPSGDEVECSSIPSDFATSDCPILMPDTGELLTVSFFANPPLGNRTDFYLFTDFVNQPGDAHVTVSVPEPGELGLFGLGLLALGVGYGLQKRHKKPRANEAA